MATLKTLKIKTGSCKRILKELHSYEKEIDREAAKTAAMKEKGADPYDLKQQENVLAESRMMLPDCRKRLESALGDLQGILAGLEQPCEEAEEIIEAKNIVKEAEALFETSSS
ncbi:tubulin-folding cofactor A [Cryptomeria japonica]|uniref:tubulin-folding cofactor A n=1 Tax=Cryptomeria japonica TaxID=3369 RepID=UPI0025AD6B1E|nr:tubulin-folding cofactor A [Cryptomeria japonica]